MFEVNYLGISTKRFEVVPLALALTLPLTLTYIERNHAHLERVSRKKKNTGHNNKCKSNYKLNYGITAPEHTKQRMHGISMFKCSMNMKILCNMP